MIDVAVVGAGISGLSVAFHLKKANLSVKVFEKEDIEGGNIRTLRKDGFILELGPQTILADESVESFLKDVGVSPEYASPSAKYRYILKRGKLIPLPLSPVEFIKSPLFSFGGKLKVLLEPFVPKSVKSEESIAEFVKRRLGEEFLNYVVAPFVSGVYAGDPRELSVKYAVKRVYELEQKFGSLIKGAIKLKALGPKGKLISFPNGNHTLIERIAENLDISKQNVVLRIRKKEDHFVLDTKEGRYEAKKVVIAAPATSASYLLREISWSAAQEFDSIYYAPIVVVHAVTSNSVPDGFGFLVPRVEGKRMLGCLFSSKLFKNRSPQGKELFTVYLGGATDPEIVEYSDDAIADLVEKEMRDILDVSVDIINITRWKRAIPQYTIGYGRYLELVDLIEKENPGLFLTGNYLYGVSVADCIRSSSVIAGKV